MRYIFGFCVVLAAANLTGMVERAYGFQAAGRRAPASPGQNAATTAENAVQQNLTTDDTTTQTPATAPTNVNQVPPMPGTVNSATSAATTAPTNPIQTPAVPGTVTTNPATGAVTTPGVGVPGTNNAGTTLGTGVPGTNNAGMMNSRTYSSNYVPATQPVTTPGTTMATTPGMTMAPGTYYQSTTAGTYGMMPMTTYSSRYVTPGYTTANQTYYAAPTQTYATPQRRGLFGGLFRRRNRQVYTTAPAGYTYGTVPGTYTYTYAPAPY